MKHFKRLENKNINKHKTKYLHLGETGIQGKDIA